MKEAEGGGGESSRQVGLGGGGPGGRSRLRRVVRSHSIGLLNHAPIDKSDKSQSRPAGKKGISDTGRSPLNIYGRHSWLGAGAPAL